MSTMASTPEASPERNTCYWIRQTKGGKWKRLDRPSVLAGVLKLPSVDALIELFDEMISDPSRLRGGPIRGAVEMKKSTTWDWWSAPLREQAHLDRAAAARKAKRKPRKK